MKVLNTILRILLGLTFCFSAIVKLYPIEPFEYTLVEQNIATWDLAPYFSRLIIAIELALGLFLILGLKLQKFTYRATLTLLSFFTLYLFIQLYKEGNVDNCGCFGTFLKMTPLESIFKNLILIAIVIWLLLKKEQSLIIKKSWMFFIIIPVSIAVPPILNPPDWYFQNNSNVINTGEIDYTKLPSKFNDQVNYKLNEGKKIIAFVSPVCPHCKLACMKLSIIKRNYPNAPIFAVFYGEEKKMPDFITETKLSIPYTFYNDLEFMKIVKGAVPAILFVENGKVSSRKEQLNLNGAEVEKFLNLKAN